MNKRKWLERFLCLAVAMVLVCVVYLGINGVPLPGKPKPEQVTSVEVYACTMPPAYGFVTETVTDPEGITLACELVEHLRYAKHISPKSDFFIEPEVSLTFTLNDGTVKKLQISLTSFWWNGTAYDAKDTTAFFESVRALYDLEAQE